MAVAMFDKIDVCESIDLSNADDSKAANSRVKKSRSKYRYDGNGNIDTER